MQAVSGPAEDEVSRLEQQGPVSSECGRLIEEIRREGTALPYPLCDKPLSANVLDAMSAVPREAFLPPSGRAYAYENMPAAIGYGQTISQPFIVALMTDLLDVEPGDAVLEVGTGSGYQAAVLSRLVTDVYSIENIAPLADSARERLQALGYDNVHVRTGDGSEGWPAHAPYDGVIVTAAGERIPPALIEQMREGARMVIPIGGHHEVQWLTVVDKPVGGEALARRVLAVRFVPLTSGTRSVDS
ncbi:MAG: protein-L-isoaspartate(D-aspartate) O-methyltransferase [Gammaproteobacteria bacterium]